MVSKGETEKRQTRTSSAKKRVLEENEVLGMPQVVAWRLMVDRMKFTTKQLQALCKEQNDDLPSEDRTPYPRNQKQKGSNYNDVLIKYLVLTMHDVGFENARLLADAEYVSNQNYSMLWREAIFRGIRPVANRELLYARMFPKSENGLALPRMKTIAEVPSPGQCNGSDAVQPEADVPKRRRADPDEDEVQDEDEDDFAVPSSKRQRAGPSSIQRMDVAEALVTRLQFQREQADRVVAAASNETLGRMLGMTVVGPELIGEARRTKMVSVARAKVMLQEKMGMSEEAMAAIWEGMSVQEVEARIGMRIKMELDGDAVPATDHLVMTAASMYEVSLQEADRMVGVMDEAERDRLAAGNKESVQLVRDWAVRRAVMGRTGRTTLAARNWVAGMAEGVKDEELAEEQRRWDRMRQEAHGAPGGELPSALFGAGSGLGTGAPVQVPGGGGQVPVTAMAGSAADLAQQNMGKLMETMGDMMQHIAQTSLRVETAQAATAEAALAREAAALARQTAPEEEGWMKFVATNAGPWNVGITPGVELEPEFDIYRQMLKDKCTTNTAALVGVQAKNPYSAQFKEAIEGVCHQQWVKYICEKRESAETEETKKQGWRAQFAVAADALKVYMQKEANARAMHKMFEEGNPGAAATMSSRLAWGAEMSEYDKKALNLERVLKKEQKDEMLPQLMQQLYGADAGQTQHRGSSIGVPHGGNPAVEAAMKQMQQTLAQLQKAGGAAAPNGGTGAGGGAGKAGKGKGTPGMGLMDGGTVAPQLAGIKIFRPTSALTAKQGRDLNSPVAVGFPHTCLLCEKQGHAVIDCPAEICTVNGERRASPRYLLSIGKCKADGSAC